MTDADKATLVRHRLAQAGEALAASRLLANQGMHQQAIGRAYYAVFYAVLALLIQYGKRASKHSGVISVFDRDFVKSGILPTERSRQLHRLFDLRQRADYQDLFVVPVEGAESAISMAAELVACIRDHLACLDDG